jgi:hypothetical protein
MTNNKVFGVLLTDQAWHDVGEALAPYASEGPIGKYIYCLRVHPDGPYFVMVATCKNKDGSQFEAEISIPHHYVKLCVSASEKSRIGFVQQ